MKSCATPWTLALVGWALSILFFYAWNAERGNVRAEHANIKAIQYQARVDSLTISAKLDDAQQRIDALDAYIAGRPQPQQRIHEYVARAYGLPHDSLGAILDRLPSAE